MTTTTLTGFYSELLCCYFRAVSTTLFVVICDCLQVAADLQNPGNRNEVHTENLPSDGCMGTSALLPPSLAFPLHIDGKGGLITIAAPHIPDVAAATANFFANVQDPKASIITTYNFLLGQASFWILRISDFIYSWQLELIARSVPASFLRCPRASTWDI